MNNEEKRIKELHLLMDSDAVECIEQKGMRVLHTFVETDAAIREAERYGVFTTLTHFLSFSNAERLFVHINGEIHELTLWNCEGTERVIRPGHNLEKLLISGEFDWWSN